MIGKTNSKQVFESATEFVNVQLSTNQSSHRDLLGAKVIVSYGTYTNEYTWNGDDVTFTVPAQVSYTVSFGDVEDYKTPSSVTFSAVEDNARTIEAVYETEIVNVDLSATDGSSLDGAVVTINGKSQTWEGTTLTQKVAYGTVYSVVAGALDGYVTPSAQTGITANSPTRSLSFSYVASSLTVNILSNQGTDAAVSSVKATVTWVDSDLSSGDAPHMAYVGNGETVNIPSNVNVNITFPEVEGYKAPSIISFTHTGGQAEKTGTYQCELLTVNVTSDNGSVSGYEVTISKQETVGVSTKYTRLEYIESTGTQYIDTGFKPNNNTRVIFSGYNTSSSSGWTFGAWDSSSSNQYAFSCLGTYSFRYGSTNTSLTTVPVGALEVDFNKNRYSMNGTTGTLSSQTFSCSYTMYLFAINAAGSVSSGKFTGRIYSCRIYNNGILVRDYIPALRSDGIAGLYDAENDAFYASSGTSNFIAGEAAAEIIGTQTSVTESYKIPFDTSYTVQASKVSGYETPDNVTRVASQKTYTITQQYVAITTVDLSLKDVYGNDINQSTANCYVVRESGQYKFPLVFGNAVKNGKTNTAAYTNNGGSYSHDFLSGVVDAITTPWINQNSSTWKVTSAYISNADIETDGVIEVTYNKSEDADYVYFNVNSIPANGGNVIISAQADTFVIWNWHIWLWPHDLSPVEITNSTGVKYNIMPVNLASKYDSDGVHIKNWFYQWGRSVPMLCPASYNSSSNHSPGTITTASKASTIILGMQTPTTFYHNESSPYNWFGTQSYYNLWDAACTGTGNSDNDTVKTVYDPCPVGWKVPNGNTFTGLSAISSANGIIKMTRYSGDTTGVEFPMAGYRHYSDGLIGGTGWPGYVWLSSSNSQNFAYDLRFRTDYINPQYTDYRTYGYPIRPVEDDNIQLDVIMISFTLNGTSYQAESGMTWFEWVNSEYNTAGCTNSGPNVIHNGWLVSLSSVARGSANYVKITDNIIGGGVYISA